MKKWLNLLCILISIINIVLMTGMASNAVSIYNDKCSELYSQGKFPEASDCWKRAIDRLDDQTNAPIFSEIEILSNCQIVIDKNDETQESSRIPVAPTSIPQNSDSDGIILSFDATNPCDMQMRIKNIYVDVIKYSPMSNQKIIKKFGVKNIRKNVCRINPATDSYESETMLNKGEYISLEKNEMENFAINVCADTPGIYEIRISLDYAIGTETHRIVIGDVPCTIGFFDEDEQ